MLVYTPIAIGLITEGVFVSRSWMVKTEGSPAALVHSTLVPDESL
jgi:hypothetical protein